MKSILVANVALTALIAAAAPAAAQQLDCHLSDPYFVVTRERTDAVGTDILMRSLPQGADAPACAFEPMAGDVQLLDRDDALYYVGMAGHYLALQRATGPDGSAVIYDMDTGTAVIDVPADDSIVVSADRMTYWARDDAIETTTANCPDLADWTAMGLGAVIARETAFDADTGQAAMTGNMHCSQTQ